MADGETVTTRGGAGFSWLHRKPGLGLAIWGIVLLWKPVAHTVVITERLVFPGNMAYLVGSSLGLLGLVMVVTGLKKDELTASALGWMGGAFLWLGWFESGFRFFAHLLQIEPVTWNGVQILSAELQIIESSVVFYVPLLVLLGLNKDTRCRMFKWFHRNATLRPEDPTRGYVRQHARITALEAIFVNWFFYIFVIILFDPRIFGPRHVITYVAFWSALIWSLYLLAFKMPRFTNPGEAIRYAIPSTGILWLCFEMASAWGWYREVWLYPIEFPVANIFLAVVFVTVGAAIMMNANRGFIPWAGSADAAPRKASATHQRPTPIAP